MLQVRMELGMHNPPAHVHYNRIGADVLQSTEHVRLSLRAAQEGLCLYKNRNNVLPIDPNKIRSLAVIGPWAVAELV